MKNLAAPFIYALEITDKCNLNCPLCGNVFEKNGVFSDLDFSAWKNILEKIKPYAREIRITGGEPTISPDFFDILKEVDSGNIAFHIFTNGLWEDTSGILAKLKNFPRFSSFLISFHGLDCVSFSKFSGQGFSRKHFDKIVKNIKCAVDAGYTVNANTVLGGNNFTQIEKIVEFLMSLGVSNISFERLIGPENDALKMSGDELKSALNKIGELQKNGKPVLYGSCIPQCFFETSSAGCLSGRSFAAISPAGYVRPCSHSPSVFGELLKDSIEDIWKSASAEKWRQNIPGACRLCGYFFNCAGACRAAGELVNAEKDPLIRNVN